ncbi:MAG: AAA family ATPase [Pseudomonadota bacterium]
MKSAVVVTGLPASGKTTVGKQIAEALSFDFLDKDDFLERLYDERGVDSWDERKTLSRESDLHFQRAAMARQSAVLVSHWRPRGDETDSGTPAHWITSSYQRVVEVHCQCDPETATKRFLQRRRHPGHFDLTRDPEEHLLKMRRFADGYPLNVGRVVNWDSQNGSISELINQVQKLLKRPV